MFGVILPGHLVNTSFVAVDSSHLVLELPSSAFEKANHVVVFLTGEQPFPEGLAAAVYLATPDEPVGVVDNNERKWHMLGLVSNQKPSAIFKVSKMKPSTNVACSRFDSYTSSTLPTTNMTSTSTSALLGISVEPSSTLESLTSSLSLETEASALPTFLSFSRSMVENLFNFVSSFAISSSDVRMQTHTESYVPLSAIQRWYETFQRRIQQNPNFWRT